MILKLPETFEEKCKINSLDIISGLILASDPTVDTEKYFKVASESVVAYFEYGTTQEATQQDIVETGMRVVLAPHLREIDELRKENEQLKHNLREVQMGLDL